MAQKKETIQATNIKVATDTAKRPKIQFKKKITATTTATATATSNIKDENDKKKDTEKIAQEEQKTAIVKPKKKASSWKLNLSPTNIFNEDNIDYRYIMSNYDFSKNKTPARITKYERALLVGKRAKQIEEGANANIVILAGQNSIEIAEEELRQRKIPLIIKRPIGNSFEYWKPADMEVYMD
jgi:DNA-directed RNA polymerase subunit K/omega